MANPSGVLTWITYIFFVLNWLSLVNRNVPDPYLDEFFHVQQAQLYLQGRWDAWHPKITTPAGLYLLSYVHVTLGAFFLWSGTVTVTWLRHLNFQFGAFHLPALFVRFPSIIADCYDVQRTATSWTDKAKRGWSRDTMRLTAYNISFFPPLFFFYGLYYTDVVSAYSVMITYSFYLLRYKRCFIVTGLISLFFRQTNIFWVAVFTGGLEVIRALPGGRIAVEYPEKPSFWDIVSGSWQHGCLYAPMVANSDLKEYLMSGASLVIVVLLNLRLVLRVLPPYLLLLAAFASFVMWNGGVVLGDKENHVASLHLTQMLYIWPYFMFFSLPMLYPWLLSICVPRRFLPKRFDHHNARYRLPSLMVSTPMMAAMLLVVHYNTIVHPFTLADNRHYMFYVFRILLRHWSIKYIVVPIYYICAWAVITAFGGQEARIPTTRRSRTEMRNGLQMRLPPSKAPKERGNTVPFVLAWLLVTSLSLITAPLVEPRYFIVPWLIWRLHTITPQPDPEKEARKDSDAKHVVDHMDHRVALETLWFLFINLGTAYMFLYRGFTWPQEPGKVQRFMW